MSYNPQLDVYEGYIYKVTNIKNGLVYIGQTIQTIEKRWYQHSNVNLSKSGVTYFDKVVNRIGSKYF